MRLFNTFLGPRDSTFGQEPIIKHSSAMGSPSAGKLTSLGQLSTDSSWREVSRYRGAASWDNDTRSLQLWMYKAFSCGRCGHFGRDVAFEMLEITKEIRSLATGIAFPNVSSSRTKCSRPSKSPESGKAVNNSLALISSFPAVKQSCGNAGSFRQQIIFNSRKKQ